jgi:hypothetical protein
MQVSKFLVAVCAAAVCAGNLAVRAQDNPAQAAARAALEQAMKGSDAPVPQTNAAPVLVDSPGVASQPTNQMATPAPAVVAPVMAAPPLDSDAQTKAREALLQQMGQPPVATPMPAPAPMTPMPVALAPAPMMAVPKPMPPVAPVPPSAGNVNVPGNEPGFTPIVAPPLPISAAKQQQLAALLAQYQADQISPEQYHTQRAAILAAP